MRSSALAGQLAHGVLADSDHDGLSDELEQRLLVQFAPAFKVVKQDCSGLPGEFEPEEAAPTLKAGDGTIYGQVFPAKGSTAVAPVAEIHYYHLWARDCGAHGHPLDTEHVSALVKASGSDPDRAKWEAMYWYAAAHEETVCDVSHLARASTLRAVDHGAEVWISNGKHASYLSKALCQGGCGADRCEPVTALEPPRLVNLGEPGAPMNGSMFIASAVWPLAGKMAESNFPAEAVARLNRLPDTNIAWFTPGRHPVQGVIAISSTTEGALATGEHDTTRAISVAGDSTGNALQKSYRHTMRALGKSAHSVGSTVRRRPKHTAPQ